MWKLLKRFLVRLLLLPILPALAWGPATHPYINKRALEIAEREVQQHNPGVNRRIVEILARNRDAFIFGGNSADAVSSYHILSGVTVYDYAHNYWPDTSGGVSVFGYKLVDEWYQSSIGRRDTTYPEADFAIACGWLAHQLADWYVHYAPIDRDGWILEDVLAEADDETVFHGYSNSHRVLGAYYYPEILALYNTADHALIEFFHDMLLLDRHGSSFLGQNRVELFPTRIVAGQLKNLLTQTSEQYEGVVTRIPPELVSTFGESFNQVIQALKALNDIAVHLNPRLVTTVANSIDPGRTGKPDYIEMSVQRVLNEFFSLSFEEIARRGSLMVCNQADGEPAIKIRETARAGTILFGLADRLTRLVDPELAVSLVKDPNSLNLRLLWGLVDLRAGIIRELVRVWGVGKLSEHLHHDPKLGALKAFLTELMRGKYGDFTAGQHRFQRRLPPLLQSAGVEHSPPGFSEIRVKVIPAVFRDQPNQAGKTIDPATLAFAVNGYEARTKPDTFELELNWDGPKMLLVGRVKPGFCQGTHHLLVSVRDRSEAPTGRLEQELQVWRKT